MKAFLIASSAMPPNPTKLTTRLLDAYSELVGVDIAAQYLARLDEAVPTGVGW